MIAAAEEQGAAAQEIIRNVSRAAGASEVTGTIAGVAEEIAAAAFEVLAASSEPSRQSKHLSAQVGRVLAIVGVA